MPTARQLLALIDSTPYAKRDKVRVDAMRVTIIGHAPSAPYTASHAEAALVDNDIGSLVSGYPDLDAELRLDPMELLRLIWNANNVGACRIRGGR